MSRIIAIANQKGRSRKDYDRDKFSVLSCGSREEGFDD